MANGGDNIPEKCKILFAEDLVSYIMLNTVQERYSASVAAPYRQFIYETFTDNIRTAVYAIAHRILSHRIIEGYPRQTQSKNKLRRFSERLRKQYFDEGFDPKYFLYYCVHVTLSACRLASVIGFQMAGDLAVKHILEGFGSYDMFSGGWQTLDLLAKERYVNARNFMDNTPNSDMALSGAEDSSSSAEEDLEDEHRLGNIEEYHIVEIEDFSNEPMRNSNEKHDVIKGNGDEFEANVEPLNLVLNKDTGCQNFQTTTSSSEATMSSDKRKEITSSNEDGVTSKRISSEKTKNVFSNYLCPASSSRDNMSLDLANYRSYKELEITESPLIIQNPSSIENKPTNSKSCPVMPDKTSSTELHKKNPSLETDSNIPKKQKVLSYSENSSNYKEK